MDFKIKPLHITKDNTYRHTVLKNLVRKTTYLYISFETDKDKMPCLSIETKMTQRFYYYANKQSLQWLMGYLLYGETEDFGINTNDTELPAGSEKELFFHLLGMDIQLAYNPLIRESSGLIEATADCPNGNIRFRIPRTQENIKLLQDFHQPINMLIG